MKTSDLEAVIIKKKSYLCVGLDPDIHKIPGHLNKNAEGVLEFCLQIIEKTEPFAAAFKVNTAFFECLGSEGWNAMETIFAELRKKDIYTIADAKRADIGNTSEQYAKAFFENLGADSITLAPYMGHDSIMPFLQYEEKAAILLALTSNPGHFDFEMQILQNGKRLFEQVLETSMSWPRKGELMFVVGATRSEEIQSIRKICPDNFLLIPGVGAQGGSLEKISRFGINDRVGILINASRSIIYAGNGKDFGEKAAAEAFDLQKQMAEFLP
jgi:orotidine-5'-phosphate decarboxylase